MIPWDYNLAFGGFQSSSATSTVNDPIDNPLSVTGDGSRPIVDWIFQNEEYTELYHQYFQEFLDTVDIQGIIENAATLIDPYVEKDPTKFCTYEEFQTGVATLKEFCQLRNESVAGHLDGSIPSTSADQKTGSASLVDASAITISDMGSMNNTMGGMGGGDFGGGGMGDMGGGHGGKGSKGDHQMQQPDGNMTAPDAASQATPSQDSDLPEMPDVSGESGEMTATNVVSQPAPSQAGGSAEPPAAPSGDSGEEASPVSGDPTVLTTDEVQQSQDGGNGDGQQPQMPTGELPQTTSDDTEEQPQDGELTETPTVPSGDNGGAQPQMPTDNGGGERPEQEEMGDRAPGGAASQDAGQTGGETLLLLGVSLLTLLIGMIVAIKYRR
jgi:hypothetical protein